MTALAVSGATMQGQGRQITVPGGGTLPFSLGVKADGLIYIAGTLAQEGDIKSQTKSVLDQIGQTLTKSGSSLAHNPPPIVRFSFLPAVPPLTHQRHSSGERARNSQDRTHDAFPQPETSLRRIGKASTLSEREPDFARVH